MNEQAQVQVPQSFIDQVNFLDNSSDSFAVAIFEFFMIIVIGVLIGTVLHFLLKFLGRVIRRGGL